MRETGANRTCGGEPLVPVTVAGGTREVCPHGPQPPCPGTCLGAAIRAQGTSSPRLVVGMKPAMPPGPSSLPSAGEALCVGDVGAGPSSPAGYSPPRQLGMRWLQSAATLYSWGFTGLGGRGAFIEPCLHFWSFLRDTFSCARPAWNHLLPGGLRGRDSLFKHFSYVACALPGWRASGAKGRRAGG